MTPPEENFVEEDNGTSAAPPPTPLPPPRGRHPREERSATADGINQADDRTIGEWLSDLGDIGQIRIKLERKWPKEWKGRPIAGFIQEYDEPFTEKDVAGWFGGGKYTVKCMRPNPRGGWMHAGGKTFEISGDPKLDGNTLGDAMAPPSKSSPTDDEVSLQGKALDVMAKVASENQRRAWALEDESRKAKGIDDTILRLVTDNPHIRLLQEQINALTRALSDKDEKLLNLVNRKPEQGLGDRLAEKIIDGESSRIEAIRTQHESEIRQLRAAHDDAVRRAEDRISRELDAREKSHTRELDSLREGHRAQSESLKQAFEARIDGMKGRITDLERQLTEAKMEVTELRARKEKGLVESMEEVVKVKSTLEGLGLAGGGDAEPPSTIEKILGMVMNNPMAQAFANRIENAPPAPPPTPPSRAGRRARPTPGPMQRVAPPPGAVPQGAPPQVPQAAQPAPIELDPADVTIAVQFMENAVRNNTSPEQFAESARSMVPAVLLDIIRTYGVDVFLDKVANPDGQSPLRTQVGRNWCRKVAKVLISGPAAPEPATPPAAAADGG